MRFPIKKHGMSNISNAKIQKDFENKMIIMKKHKTSLLFAERFDFLQLPFGGFTPQEVGHLHFLLIA